jgi:hypothetical protein
LLKQVRQLHLYLGVFFAPSIIFFALTGSLQLVGLHEGHPGEAYQPPAWVQKLGLFTKTRLWPKDADRRRVLPENKKDRRNLMKRADPRKQQVAAETRNGGRTSSPLF